MSALYLLRHGPTEASRAGAPLGRLDLPVSPEGQSQWPGVKAFLLQLPVERVICSPLRRSRLHAQDLGLPCEVVEDLCEQAFGAWDGQPWASLPPERTAAFFADPIRTAPPDGESFAACAGRAVTSLAPRLVPDGPPTLVLAHGGPLRALLAHLLGLPLERAVDLDWGPFGLSLIHLYEPQRGLLRFHNRAL